MDSHRPLALTAHAQRPLDRAAPAAGEPVDSEWSEGLKRGLLAGLAVLAIVIPPTRHWYGHGGNGAEAARVGSAAVAPSTAGSTGGVHGIPPAAALLPAPRYADFGSEQPSPDARQVADWVADSRDNAGMSFVIVDKKAAKVYVFDAEARVRASTPVLIGSARGDDSAPGIGTKPIAQVTPDERTTPAGRFIGQIGQNAIGEDVVWVDYDAAVSMHRVRTTNAKEHRLERLASPTIADNRISYGCINMPVAFYETYVQPTFRHQKAPIYVLPDVKSLQQVFGAAYDVAARHANDVRGAARAGDVARARAATAPGAMSVSTGSSS